MLELTCRISYSVALIRRRAGRKSVNSLRRAIDSRRAGGRRARSRESECGKLVPSASLSSLGSELRTVSPPLVLVSSYTVCFTVELEFTRRLH